MANRRASQRLIGPWRPATKEDLVSALAPAYQHQVTTAKLRDSHHRVARLTAGGARPFEVAAVTGYSSQRINQLLSSPAMQELIATYRAKVNGDWVEEASEDYADAVATRRLALRQRRARLEAAEFEESDPIPLRDLNATIADLEDRYGQQKRSTNINVHADFAAELDKAIARSEARIIEAKPQSPPNLHVVRRI